MANSGYSTIRLRRDTTTNWTSTTPSAKTLAYGEVGIDVTTGKLKFGNNSSGVQAWASAKDVAVIQADQATAATTATNLAGTTVGSIPWQSASATTSYTAAGTTNQFLQSNGTSAPTWVKPTLSTTYFGTATTAADLAGVLTSSEITGTAGKVVYSQAPTITQPTITSQGAIFATSGSGTVTLTAGSGSGSYAIALPNETTATLLSSETAASTYVGISGTQTITGAKTLSGTTVISGATTLSNASITLSNISGKPGSGTLPVQASSTGALSAAAVNLATAHVTGTLGLGNGGLGATTVTGARATLRIYVQSTAPSSPQVGDVWFW